MAPCRVLGCSPRSCCSSTRQRSASSRASAADSAVDLGRRLYVVGVKMSGCGLLCLFIKERKEQERQRRGNGRQAGRRAGGKVTDQQRLAQAAVYFSRYQQRLRRWRHAFGPGCQHKRLPPHVRCSDVGASALPSSTVSEGGEGRIGNMQTSLTCDCPSGPVGCPGDGPHRQHSTARCHAFSMLMSTCPGHCPCEASLMQVISSKLQINWNEIGWACEKREGSVHWCC